MLLGTYYAQNYASIIGGSLAQFINCTNSQIAPNKTDYSNKCGPAPVAPKTRVRDSLLISIRDSDSGRILKLMEIIFI